MTEASEGAVVRRPQLRRLLLVGIPTLLLVVAVLCAWQLVHVARGMLKSQDQATELRASLEARDLPAAYDDVVALRETAEGLRERTGGITWSLMTHFPVVGADLAALRTASSGLETVAHGAEAVLGVGADPDGLLRGDRVSIRAVRELSVATNGMEVGFRQLERAVTELSASRFGYVRGKASALTDPVAAGAEAVSRARPVLESAPALLGAEGRRNYLLVFQNNAEIRATGGLLGSAAWLTVEDGRLGLEQTFSPILKTDEAGVEFDFTAAEATLYREELGRGAVFLNSMPDFARVAGLLRQGWQGWFSAPLDGVISIDVVSLSYLMNATGPIEVMGQTLSAGNVVDELLSGAYARYPDNEGQDAFFSAVSDKTFGALTSGRVDGPALVSALRRMDQESRLALHFFADELDAANRDPFDPDADKGIPVVTVGLNNASGDKMSYYLRSAVSVTSRCAGDRQSLTGVAALTSSAPVDATSLPPRVTEVRPETPTIGGVFRQVPLGSQMVQVVLRAPAGGSIGAVEFAGAPVTVTRVRQDGLEVATFDVELPPQRTLQVTWQMSTARSATGDAQVLVTPGIEPADASSRVASACG